MHVMTSIIYSNLRKKFVKIERDIIFNSCVCPAGYEFKYFKSIVYNPGQNISQKVKKYSKIGQDLKNVIYNFACFLTAVVNV